MSDTTRRRTHAGVEQSKNSSVSSKNLHSTSSEPSDHKDATDAVLRKIGPIGSRQTPMGTVSRPKTHVSISTTLVMVTLLVFGVVGTLRMRKHAIQKRGSSGGPVILTPEELQAYTGRRGSPIYVAILGSVFDVTSGKQKYGPGGSYHFFAGRDASRAFVTGKFKDDLNDDVRDLSPENMRGLIEWRTFYRNHASYRYVGKVVGNFYSSKGHASPLLGIVEMSGSEVIKKQEEERKNPSKSEVPCAFRWHKDTGGFVSCDPEGGTYPRRVMTRQGDDSVIERCLCLPQNEINATVVLYDGCAADSHTCQSKKRITSSEL